MTNLFKICICIQIWMIFKRAIYTWINKFLHKIKCLRKFLRNLDTKLDKKNLYKICSRFVYKFRYTNIGLQIFIKLKQTTSFIQICLRNLVDSNLKKITQICIRI